MPDFFEVKPEESSDRPGGLTHGPPGSRHHDDRAAELLPAPLADRMRPRVLDEFIGQEDAVGMGSPLRHMIETDKLRSLIFWGPPGSGKTTLAGIVAHTTKSVFVTISAVTASIKDVKAMMEEAKVAQQRTGRRTILFVDEIHRFNRAQQDAFLPFVEAGSIILIGATTENPSFSLVSALLSRCAVFVLKPLSEKELHEMLVRALQDTDRGLGHFKARVDPAALDQIARIADGDARRGLNLLELAVESAPRIDGLQPFVDIETLGQVLKRQTLLYDRAGEEHYNLISALHKSMRGSDPQGAAYWAGRMLESGETPMYLARRMIRFASEDIGNADPQALVVAIAAREAFDMLGSPEGDLALVQCAIYLATAPKSIAVYAAHNRVKAEIQGSGSLPVPHHIRNAPTRLMKDLGYSKGYQYDPTTESGVGGQDYLPEGVRERVYYEPQPIGFEREIVKRMEWWERKRDEAKQGQTENPESAESKSSKPRPGKNAKSRKSADTEFQPD